MKYFIIAGEASGDLHGSNVVKEIYKLDKLAVFKGIGGDLLKDNQVEILFGLDRLAFMGFYEVLKNLRTIRRNFKEIKQAILDFKPDVVILLDYPGFNLRMAKWCKQHGFKVAYYISPQIWAWKKNRVEVVKKYVDIMLCILPFEKAFYEKHGYKNVHFVGHPLLDIFPNDKIIQHSTFNIQRSSLIALLPGSRKQEINSLLPLMLQSAQNFPTEKFIITGISRLKDLYPKSFPANVTLVFDKTHEILQNAKAAIVCSGTATLETALFNVPQVVIYKTSWLNYQIGKRLAKVDFISLPNLIANQKVVTELIQQDCNVTQITSELKNLLQNSNPHFYEALQMKIGENGASAKAARLIYNIVHIPNINEIINILLAVKEKITDDSDLMWTHYETALELRKEIEDCILQLKENDKNILSNIKIYFAPTGTFQEHSIQNGWSKEYLQLASKFDSIIESQLYLSK